MNLENLYSEFNKRELVYPDPLAFLYKYTKAEDREIVALIASALAYGRVSQILKSVEKVLTFLGNNPYEKLLNSSESEINTYFKNFKHRFTTSEELSSFLLGIKKIIEKYDSIQNIFILTNFEEHETLLPGLCFLYEEMLDSKPNSLFPDPNKGSACKRMMLFLKWMVRSDIVDPGGWDFIPRSKLIIPLDTHMFRFAKTFNFTKRTTADIIAAIEITNKFKLYSPDDPTKYDFAITRFGIRPDFKWSDLCLNL